MPGIVLRWSYVVAAFSLLSACGSLHCQEPPPGADEDREAQRTPASAPDGSPRPDAMPPVSGGPSDVLLLSAGTKNHGRIISVQLPGAVVTRLTDPAEGVDDDLPVPSPDGRFVLFIRRTGPPEPPRINRYSVLDLRSGESRRLNQVETNQWGARFLCNDRVRLTEARTSANDPRGMGNASVHDYSLAGERLDSHGHSYFRPQRSSWSQDQTVTADIGYSAGRSGPLTVHIERRDGERTARCRTPVRRYGDGTYGWEARGRASDRRRVNARATEVSPDGRFVAVLADQGSMHPTPDSERIPATLYVVEVESNVRTDGGRLGPICSWSLVAGEVYGDVHWSGDSSTLVYLAADGGQRDVYLWRPGSDGERSRRLTNDPLHEIEAVPNADGTRVAVVSTRGPFEGFHPPTRVAIVETSSGDRLEVDLEAVHASAATWLPRRDEGVPCESAPPADTQ